MKTATPSELFDIVFDNENLFGSINHVQNANQELLNELFSMPDCTLHYVITGDCLMIFSKPNQQ
jgi:hypothetical protein